MQIIRMDPLYERDIDTGVHAKVWRLNLICLILSIKGRRVCDSAWLPNETLAWFNGDLS